jgi:hypothetical protein
VANFKRAHLIQLNQKYQISKKQNNKEGIANEHFIDNKHVQQNVNTRQVTNHRNDSIFEQHFYLFSCLEHVTVMYHAFGIFL